jgi:hypothetical protein
VLPGLAQAAQHARGLRRHYPARQGHPGRLRRQRGDRAERGGAGGQQAYKPDVVCLEPYPSADLQERAKQVRIRQVDRPAQMVDFDTIAHLGAGDLLFIG